LKKNAGTLVFQRKDEPDVASGGGASVVVNHTPSFASVASKTNVIIEPIQSTANTGTAVHDSSYGVLDGYIFNGQIDI
jgi:hypothetical protein